MRILAGSAAGEEGRESEEIRSILAQTHFTAPGKVSAADACLLIKRGTPMTGQIGQSGRNHLTVFSCCKFVQRFGGQVKAF